MTDLPELWRNAAAMGVAALGGAVVARVRGVRAGIVLVALLAIAGAAYRGMLDRAWALDSLVHDAPWGPTLILAAWAAMQGAGWLRVRSWPVAVALAVVLGDSLVAIGLAAAEPDPRRRARLVLAASGASLVGFTSGAAPLLLGWGGGEAVLVGLVLALVGYCGGTEGAGVTRPDARGAGLAALVAIGGGLLTWTLMLSGALELVAQGLERAPIVFPRQDELLVAASGLVGGAVGDEGVMALYTREALARALELRTEDTTAILRAGLAVGGGLPMLFATRSSLRVGLPLWLVQVAMVVAWSYWR
jgi:hypothetical protein